MKTIKPVMMILWTLMVHCGTSSAEISILKYSKDGGCNKTLVEVPIKPNTLMKEFTYCGKYSFRFLRESVLMGLEPNTYLWMMNFEEKNAGLKYNGMYYFFDFNNQKIIPDEWQHLCLGLSLNKIKIVLNGEILLNKTVANLFTEEIEASTRTMWFGGYQGNSKWHTSTRLEGLMTDVNVWNESLDFENLTSITRSSLLSNTIPIPDLFLWSTFKMQSNSSCVTHLTLDENDMLFQNNYEDTILIEYLTDFNSSNLFCQALGGQLSIPENIQELHEVTLLVQQSEHCNGALLGLKKSKENSLVDLNGKVAPFVKWGNKQPNGENFQQCISVWRKGKPYFDDVRCNIDHCFLCKMSTKKLFSLRGKIASNIESEYLVDMTKTSIDIRGVKEAECFWNESTWHFGQYLNLSSTSSRLFPPVGAKMWSTNR